MTSESDDSVGEANTPMVPGKACGCKHSIPYAARALLQMQEAADSTQNPCGMWFVIDRVYWFASRNEYDRIESCPLSASRKPIARSPGSSWNFARVRSSAHAASMHNRDFSSPERRAEILHRQMRQRRTHPLLLAKVDSSGCAGVYHSAFYDHARLGTASPLSGDTLASIGEVFRRRVVPQHRCVCLDSARFCLSLDRRLNCA